MLNGNDLAGCTGGGSGYACDDVPMPEPDGWMLKDPSTIELVGATCVDFLARRDVMLRASFPCHIFVQ